MSEDAGNPAVQARRLRAALRQARQEAGLTQEQVAAALEWSLSKIVRIERGPTKPGITDVRALLGQYKINDAAQVNQLVEMARQARKRPWWHAYKGYASDRYLEFVEFEHAAQATLHVQPLWVPGILQTREYATAIIWRLARDLTPEKADGLLELRMHRQKLLEQPDPPPQSFVIDESVLRRRVESEKVMAAQLDRLIELAARPAVTIQVLPFSAGPAYGMQTSFVIHKLADEDDLDVLYLEGPRGDTIVADDVAEIRRYERAFEELQQMALSAADTVTFIKELRSAMQ
ncbi:MAG TPA: helix-turn-helix transcriptional regulator [Streptosporangiaceae bacterium]|jgi:transcriptional regulator with XRE-family HTH domain